MNLREVRPSHNGPWRLALLGLALFVAGCANQSTVDVGERSIRDRLDSFRAAQSSQEKDDLYQEMVAKCMKVHGFDYLPIEQERAQKQEPRRLSLWSGVDRQYVAVHGFGIADARIANLQVTPGSLPAPLSTDADTVDGSKPYRDALLGSPSDLEGVAPKGCLEEARIDVFASDDDLELLELVAALSDRLESDSRIRSVEQEWSRCMSEQGYRIDSEEQLVDSLLGKAEEFRLERSIAIDPKTGIPIEQPRIEPSEVSVVLDSLKVFKVTELKAALADFSCIEPLSDELESAINAIETEILLENSGLGAD